MHARSGIVFPFPICKIRGAGRTIRSGCPIGPVVGHCSPVARRCHLRHRSTTGYRASICNHHAKTTNATALVAHARAKVSAYSYRSALTRTWLLLVQPLAYDYEGFHFGSGEDWEAATVGVEKLATRLDVPFSACSLFRCSGCAHERRKLLPTSSNCCSRNKVRGRLITF